MILTKKEILKEIKKGKLKITPFNKKNVGPVSVDLILGNEFRIFTHDVIDLKREDYTKVTKVVKMNQIELKPGELILGITKEKICMPDYLIGRLGGRSRYARVGLLVHMTANLVQPGVCNRQVLEIKNASTSVFRLHSGMKICQIMFEEIKGNENYKGKFRDQGKL
ncbi:MAG: dCTP deaminase [Nanoarchaeota archaeon]|nr:dCTP deaminase [Nanoarchaeota archaeon]